MGIKKSKQKEQTCYQKTLEKFLKTNFLRVINFEKRQIAEKGRKRQKNNCRPDADLDKLKRPNWSETTKYGNTDCSIQR